MPATLAPVEPARPGADPSISPKLTSAGVPAVAPTKRGRGIRFQMTTAFTGVIVMTALCIAVSGNVILRRTLRDQVSERTSQVEGVVREVARGEQRELEHRADLLANNEALRNQFHYESWSDVQKSLTDMRAAQQVDIALGLDADGNLQATSGADPALATQIAASHVRQPLKNAPGPASVLEPVAGRIYVIAGEAVSYFGNRRGIVLLARQLTDATAIEMRKQTGAEIFAFADGALKASSLPSGDAIAQAIASAWPRLGKSRIDLGTIQLAGEPYYAMAMPIVIDGKTVAGIAFAQPEKQIEVAQTRTLQGAVAIAIIITLLGGILGLTLAGRIAQPIVFMASQFRRIASSFDLSLRVPATASNEIGDMARSFNAMQDRVETLHQEVAKAEERMREELRMASTVQEMLFQQTLPQNSACDLAAYTSTLVETSGDWYAVFDDPAARKTVFIVADATGHGAPAALLTAITSGYFQTLWAQKGARGFSPLVEQPPSVTLTGLNDVVLALAPGTISATVFVGVLDHATRRLVYGSAGHTPPIIARHADDGQVKVSLMRGVPTSSIGTKENGDFVDIPADLQPGDTLLLYTDGLTEAENADGQQFGARRIMTMLRNSSRESVESMRQRIIDDVQTFVGKHAMQDDMTYIAIRIR